MSTLTLINKKMNVIRINNVTEIYLSNMAENEDEKDWNFISVITNENNKLKKQIIKLEEIYQFTLTKNKE